MTTGQRVSLNSVESAAKAEKGGLPYFVWEHVAQGSPTLRTTAAKETYRHSLAVTGEWALLLCVVSYLLASACCLAAQETRRHSLAVTGACAAAALCSCMFSARVPGRVRADRLALHASLLTDPDSRLAHWRAPPTSCPLQRCARAWTAALTSTHST